MRKWKKKNSWKCNVVDRESWVTRRKIRVKLNGGRYFKTFVQDRKADMTLRQSVFLFDILSQHGLKTHTYMHLQE